jgi:hypothetical protein
MRTKTEAYRLGEGDRNIDCWNEHIYCDKCGKEIEEFEVNEGDNTELCAECYLEQQGYNDTLTLENALKCGEGEEVTIEINPFWQWYFSRREIPMIFEREWDKVPDEDKAEILHAYAKEIIGLKDWAKTIMNEDINE